MFLIKFFLRVNSRYSRPFLHATIVSSLNIKRLHKTVNHLSTKFECKISYSKRLKPICSIPWILRALSNLLSLPHSKSPRHVLREISSFNINSRLAPYKTVKKVLTYFLNYVLSSQQWNYIPCKYIFLINWVLDFYFTIFFTIMTLNRLCSN